MDAPASTVMAAASTEPMSRLPMTRAQPIVDNRPVSASMESLPASKRRSLLPPPRATGLTTPSTPVVASADPANRRKRQSLLMQPGFQTPLASSQPQFVSEGRLRGLPRPASPTKTLPHSSYAARPAPMRAPATPEPANHASPRKARLSLSDRTVETLAQVPPSPSSARRQSLARQSASFGGTESGIRPLSRTSSTYTIPQPSSVASAHPTSPDRRPLQPTQVQRPPAQRPQSFLATPKTSAAATKAPLSTHRMTPAASQAASGTHKLPSTAVKAPPGHQKPSLRQPPGKLVRGTSPTKTASSVQTARPSTRPRQLGQPTMVTATKRGSMIVTPKATASTHRKTPSVTASTTSALPQGSRQLREAIHQAKAIGRQSNGPRVPRMVNDDPSLQSIADVDTHTPSLADSTHVNIMRKRLRNAREDGKLNLAALCLTEIPDEVIRMYDFTGADDGTTWYESVDVVKLNAGDNDLSNLPDVVFPRQRLGDANSVECDDDPVPVFAGLESMDLHGNQILHLPSRMANLERLTSLNLCRNKLDVGQSLSVICRITSLRELRLAENILQGPLPSDFGALEALQVLDLHGNSLTELPSTLGRLSKLQILDVSHNRLTSLPMEALFDLPLVELEGHHNRLEEAFFPSSIPAMSHLKHLRLAHNALTALTHSQLTMPQLQTLDISFNRIAALPDLSSWSHLTQLNAEENKISELPIGFTDLKHLKMADFNLNSLLQLEAAIGHMDSLTTLRVTNNPLRERRLLRMTTEELKSDLRERLSSPTIASEKSTDTMVSMSLLSPNLSEGPRRGPFAPLERAGSSYFKRVVVDPTPWKVVDEVLDRSHARLHTIEASQLDSVRYDGVRSFVAHHNQLQCLPPPLEMLGTTLTSLDLSHNRLGQARDGLFLDSRISLPMLQTLNLTSNGLSSLASLTSNLDATQLATLIVSFNRLTAIPNLHSAFPSLTKFLASNNLIATLDVSALRGLQVLDVSSNELEHLPAKLGLLQGQLRTLMVSGNKFRVPGWGILEKGTEEILKWCRLKIPEGDESF